MSDQFYSQIRQQLETTRQDGLFKQERTLTSAQQAEINVANSPPVINFCANNYLGLANHPALIQAAKDGMDTHGFGMASVRFICGTQDSHQLLERRLAEFLGMEEAILFSSCFDANGGLFETCWARKTRLSRMRSTMRRSSTASACAKPSAIVTPTMIWLSCARLQARDRARAIC